MQKFRLRAGRFAAELARRKLSQNAWAQKLGVSKAYLSQLVNGRRQYPGASVRHRILQALELPEDELFEAVPTDADEGLAPNPRGAGPSRAQLQTGSHTLLDIHLAGLHFRLEAGGSQNRGTGMEDLWGELEYAFRGLRRNPGVAALAILILALAIGANTTLFSAISATLLQPLPFPQPDRVVRIWSSNPTQGWSRGSLSPPNFLDLQRENQSFAAMAVFDSRNGILTGGVRPSSLEISWVSPGIFRTLAVEPVLGRGFNEDEVGPGADRVAVISHRLWSSTFGQDPSVVGTSLTLNDQQLTIVGVMPDGFGFPSPNTDLWKPFGIDLANQNDRGSSFVSGVGRLQRGVTLEQAQQEVERIARDLEAAFPDANRNHSFFLESLHDAEVRNVKRALMTLWGAVAIILLIACVNVANLLLVRAARRRKEFSLRAVLGAEPRRIVRQLLLESSILAVLATLAGLALTISGNRLLTWLVADQLPRVNFIQLDWRVALFSIGLTLITPLLFGLAPALQGARFQLTDALRDRGGSSSQSLWLRNGLVVGQVALALVLLTGAGLLLRSFHSLLNVDLGFDPKNLISFRVEPPMLALRGEEAPEDLISSFERDRARASRFMEDLVNRLEALPGVTRATAVNRMPLSGNMWQTSVAVAGRTYQTPQDQHPATNRDVLPGYFVAMGIPLLRGRTFNSTDRADRPTSVIINRAMAEAYWPDSDPLGARITSDFPPPTDKFWMTVVGVVENVRHDSLLSDPSPLMYVPMEQTYFGFFGNWGMDVLLRTSAIPSGFSQKVEDVVASLNPDLPISRFRSMDEVMSESIASRTFTLLLLGFFAALALLLAFVGIYGIISYLATQRRPEYGIRTALGARPGDLLKEVLSQSFRVTVVGVVIGVACSLLLSEQLAPLLYRISATDPATLLGVCLLMLLVGLGAGFLPAWRASRLDVNQVLRSAE